MIESSETLSKGAEKRLARAEFIEKYAIFIIFVLLILISTLVTGGTTLKFKNIINILVQNTPVAIIAMGVCFVIISGGIDLSLGSVIALVAVTTAGVGQVGKLPFILSVCVGLSVGGLCGFINGLFITKTKIPPFIATLGMYTSARGMALVVVQIFTDTGSISNLNDGLLFLGQGKMLGINTPIWILLLVFAFSHILLSSTKMGRYAYAIGGNLKAAQVSGISTDRYLLMIYTFSGLLAGVAGIVIIGILGSGQPTLGVLYELEGIAAAVIGGTSLSAGIGTIPGTLIGALFVGVLKNTMDLKFISAYWQDIARGIVIVVAVVIDVRKQRLLKH